MARRSGISLGFIFLASCGILEPVEPPEIGSGVIAVSSYPSEASIWLNGNLTGAVTPDSLVRLLYKTHEIEVRMKDYDPVSKSIELTPEHPYQKVHFSLEKERTTVTSTPPGAKIYLGGVPSGFTTPASVPNGNAHYRCMLAGYFPVEAHFPEDAIPQQVHFDFQTAPPVWISAMEDDEIHLISPDGLETIVVVAAEGYNPTWSSDGQLLAYRLPRVYGETGVQIVDRVGSPVVLMEEGNDVAWSTLGTLLANAVWDQLGTYDVMLDRYESLSFSSEGRISNPEFSPDDRAILFETDIGNDNYSRAGIADLNNDQATYVTDAERLDEGWNPPYSMLPQWISRDDILYLKSDGLYEQDLSLGLEGRVFEDLDIRLFKIAPDKASVAVLGSQGLFIFSLPDWNLVTWWEKDELLDVYAKSIDHLAWSPDSDTVVFYTWDGLWWFEKDGTLIRIIDNTRKERNFSGISVIRK